MSILCHTLNVPGRQPLQTMHNAVRTVSFGARHAIAKRTEQYETVWKLIKRRVKKVKKETTHRDKITIAPVPYSHIRLKTII